MSGLGLLVERAAARRGTAAAIHTDDGAVSWADLLASVRRVAGGLADLGIRSGDRVALWLPNGLPYLTLTIACARLGGWMYMHITDSRRSAAVGFPDLVLCHPLTGRTLYVELKTSTGKLRPEQVTWMRALTLSNEAYVWRPEHWASDDIQRLLLNERRFAA